jgi:hypothetical protein
MAMHFNTYGNAKVMKSTAKIYRKRLYQERYRLRPDELGLARIYNTLDRSKHKIDLEARLFTRRTESALATD